ncbi:CII family transcriptional regulator [Serratia sp. IR-2025]
METASYSKPTEQEINRAESDLLMAVSAISGREFAKMVGCHESKISRTDWRYIATILCVAKKSVEFSFLGRMVQEMVLAAMPRNEKSEQCANTFSA